MKNQPVNEKEKMVREGNQESTVSSKLREQHVSRRKGNLLSNAAYESSNVRTVIWQFDLASSGKKYICRAEEMEEGLLFYWVIFLFINARKIDYIKYSYVHDMFL